VRVKALLLDRPGRPETLRIADLPAPEPGPGEIRVRVRAAGLNPVDYKLAASGHSRWRYPFVLGLDVAGVVDALGPGVSQWKPGDAVYYHGDLSRPGGFAEFAVTTAHTAAPVPATLSFAQAAALPCAGFAAYQAVHRRLHVAAGQTVLVQGAAGGVGGFAVQLAALQKARVIGTCSAENAAHVRRLGAALVIDYRQEDIAARVRALTTGRGVDAIVDAVSSASATLGLELLAFGGGLACIAGLPDFARWRPFARALSVHEIALGGAHLSGDRPAQDDLARIGRELGALAGAGIDPMLEHQIDLAEVPAALARIATGHGRGKTVAVLP